MTDWYYHFIMANDEFADIQTELGEEGLIPVILGKKTPEQGWAEVRGWSLTFPAGAGDRSIFTRCYYISPQDLFITNYPRTQPVATFNQGALERDGKLLVFPRLVFDYYTYNFSAGAFKLDIEEVVQGRIRTPLETEIVLWPERRYGSSATDARTRVSWR